MATEEPVPSTVPVQEGAATPAAATDDGASSRAEGSVAPAAAADDSLARKHGLDTSLILNEPRKRAKREPTDVPPGVPGPSSSHKGKKKEPVHFDDPAFVLDKGMQLLETVRAASENNHPDGRLIATDFLKLPNRRQYPDYYELIKQPIALDDIEAKIKASEYPSLDAVRADIEHCFVNAKRYNANGSVIFSDAKILHKLTKTTYAQLLPADHPEHKAPPKAAPPHAPSPPPFSTASQPVASTSAAAAAGAGKKHPNQHTKKREAEDKARALAAEAEAARKAAADKADKKPPKAPSVWKLLKLKLDKVTQMKEKDTGRVLAYEFMDLIPKSLYPDYYKIIKKPMSFNLVYQKLKRKDYDSADELADDVDLIFSNALVFNMDGSQIADDAMALKEKFHSLVDEMLTENRTAPPAQAKASQPLTAVPSHADSEPKGKGIAAAGEAPASIAKIKIKKKTKAGGEESAAPMTMPAEAQPMDVDPAPPVPTQSLDPTTLAALQDLVTSGAFELGTQHAAAEAGPSAPLTSGGTPAPASLERRLSKKAQEKDVKRTQPQQAPPPPAAASQSPLPQVQPLQTSVAQLVAPAVPAPPLLPKVKLPAIVASFLVRFPGSSRPAVWMRNEKGVKAHVLSLSEQEISLVLDVRNPVKGKAREVNDGALSAPNGASATRANGSAGAGGDADMTSMDFSGALTGEANALPSSSPPKRLFSIQVFNNTLPVDSFPPSLRRQADDFTADPPTAFNLTLGANLARPGVAGPGAWIVEVSVRWRDVDELSGAVLEQGAEGYELFLRR